MHFCLLSDLFKHNLRGDTSHLHSTPDHDTYSFYWSGLLLFKKILFRNIKISQKAWGSDKIAYFFTAQFFLEWIDFNSSFQVC